MATAPAAVQRRILVIDDNPQNLLLMGAQLEREGYVVQTATTGRAGLDTALEWKPDIILLDVMMPGLNGYEVCTQLRENESMRTVPILILTSLRERQDKLRALEAGADDFLSKPIDRAELLARVRSLLRSRILFQELTESRDEVTQQAEQLALEKSRAEAVLYSMADGVITTDANARVMLVNPVAERLGRLTLEEARGKDWHSAFHVANPWVDGEAGMCVARVAIETGAPAPRRELILRPPSGPLVTVSAAASPVRSASGQITGAVVVLHDITEEKVQQLRLALQAAVNRVLAEAPGRKTALPRLLEAIGRSMEWNWGALWAPGPDGELKMEAAWRRSANKGAATSLSELTVGIAPSREAELAWTTGQVLWKHDDLSEVEYGGESLVSRVWCPLGLGNDTPGVLEFTGSQPMGSTSMIGALLEVITEQVTQFWHRKVAEEALTQTQHHLQTVIANSPIVLFSYDEQGELVFAQGRGLPSASANGRVAAQDNFTHQAGGHVGRALAGDSFTAELKSDGRVFETQYAPLNLDTGGVRGVIGVALDITDRKRAEEERLQLMAEVERERTLLTAVLASMGDGVVVMDDTQRILYCNAKAADWLHTNRASVVGANYADVFQAVEHLIDRPEVPRAAWEDASKHVHDYPQFELDIVDPNPRSILATLFPVGGSVEQPSGVTGLLLQDVTAQRDLARTKDELISVVNHELRTPLASIMGFAELLLNRPFPPEEQREFITTILDEGKRLTSLINEFLDLQRIEAGREHITPEVADIREIVQRAIRTLGPDPERLIIAMLPEQVPKLFIDPERVQQVLVNLFSNARKYSPDGGDVFVKAAMLGSDMLQVSIEDHGLGIPPDSIPRLFERFFRVDNGDRRPIRGTGLGLAITREIVQAHGGRVWAESEGVGSGTTFHLTLPVAEILGECGDVLLVEDDPVYARLLEQELEDLGHSVTRAANGEAALDLLSRAVPRLIVLDLLLPGIQGEAFLAQAWQAELIRQPVIVVSVKDLTHQEQEALRAHGASEVLRKEQRASDAARLAADYLKQKASAG